MRKLLIISIGCLFAVCLTFVNASAQASSIKTDMSTHVWIPCALDGTGEYVLLEGTLHIVANVFWDNAGNLHVTGHSQPQGVKGVGLTSGDKYIGTGVTRYNYIFGSVGFPIYIETYINNFRIIGEGNGNNYLIHQNLHMTINANGEVTAYVDNYEADCK